ncbi:MAG: nitrous oxide reductase accessory protein NosL [Bacteroidetes bacterium]|nr:nitrous oxide reductase accessory protein NosL [Bacteroidota bacterium]
MKADKAAPWIRMVLLLCALALIAVIFIPMWRIELSAPQYPEGLVMLIYPGKLGGNIDIINGLNHYIGMKTLHANDFIEFTVLPYIVGFFALLFIITGLSRSKKLIYFLFILFIAFAVLAMVDFWRWEYNYGHNLNPDAAIVVLGMAYQPPLLGYKQLLNFGAFSIPDIGGWIFIAVGVLLFLCTIAVWRSQRKPKSIANVTTAILLFSFSLAFTSCSSKPQAIVVGKDNCDFCKMGVSDARFGAEILTQKGRVYKFDDVHCLLGFLKENNKVSTDVKEIYFVNYSGQHDLIPKKNVLLLKSELLKSPMAGNIAAFNNADSIKKIQQINQGQILNLSDLNLP